MSECQYQSFNTLAKISDPHQLLLTFRSLIGPEITAKTTLQIYEQIEDRWYLLSDDDSSKLPAPAHLHSILDELNLDQPLQGSQYYSSALDDWFFSYKPLGGKTYTLHIDGSETANLDSTLIQVLFQFYCHQYELLQGSLRDALTGLFNRKAFETKLNNLFGHQSLLKLRRIRSLPGAFVMLDIDHFKNVNDNFGHLFGDEVLLLISRMMQQSFRDNDLLFRYGGEEFAMVLMDLQNEDILEVLERFRQSIESFDFPVVGKVTISIGYTLTEDNKNLDELIQEADSALYYSKENGRNRITAWADMPENDGHQHKRASA